MASGIKDKVVILGMGCSKFGERWDASPSDLMVEAFEECIEDAGVQRNQIEAAWFGAGIDAFNVGASPMSLESPRASSKGATVIASAPPAAAAKQAVVARSMFTQESVLVSIACAVWAWIVTGF